MPCAGEGVGVGVGGVGVRSCEGSCAFVGTCCAFARGPASCVFAGGPASSCALVRGPALVSELVCGSAFCAFVYGACGVVLEGSFGDVSFCDVALEPA